MAKETVSVFPDTNLFLQCKALAELDWSLWSDFSQIDLVVCTVVQREIDSKKYGGNHRVTRRARSTSSLFRKVVLGESSGLIRESSPRVQLHVNSAIHHDPSLSDRLNYVERDDQLVGTIHSFRKEYPEQTVQLLTHDATPISTARSLGIDTVVIPDTWLLPAESTLQEKKIAKLQKDLQLLQAQEPNFSIHCYDNDDKQIADLTTTYVHFRPLSCREIRSLLSRLVRCFPMRESFPRGPEGVFMMYHEFSPVSDEQIEEYTRLYKQWLVRIEEALRESHNVLRLTRSGRSIKFKIRNSGTRPAEDVRLSFQTTDDFRVVTSRDSLSKEGNQSPRRSNRLGLNLPPTPPEGQWVQVLPYLGESVVRRRPAERGGRADTMEEHEDRELEPPAPQSRVSLTRDEWRHEEEHEVFEVVVHGKVDADVLRGMLVCRLWAKNLSRAQELRVPLRFEVDPRDSLSLVKDALDRLGRGPRSVL